MRPSPTLGLLLGLALAALGCGDLKNASYGIAFPVAIALSGKTVLVASAGTKPSYADGKILRLSLAE